MKVRYTGEVEAESVVRRALLSVRDRNDKIVDLRGSVAGSLQVVSRRGRALAYLLSQNGTPYVFNYSNFTTVQLNYSEASFSGVVTLTLNDLLPSGVVGNRHIFTIRSVSFGQSGAKKIALWGWVKDKYDLIFNLSDDFGMPNKASGIFEFFACPILDVAEGEVPFVVGLEGQGSCFIAIYGQYEESY